MSDLIDLEEVEGELNTRLGFCGCGMPEEALLLIHELLEYIEARSQPYTGSFTGPEWDKHCKDDLDAITKVIKDNPEGVKYVLFYLLDDKNITEHGGSVPGYIEDHEFRDKLKSYIEYIYE